MKVSIVKCGGYDIGEVREAVNRALDLIGGLTDHAKPQGKVILKVNSGRIGYNCFQNCWH